MLNPFPIQFLAPLAFTILRLCVGMLLIRLGFTLIKTNRVSSHTLTVLGLFEIVVGISFFIGFGTQWAALATLCVSLISLVSSQFRIKTHALPRIFFVLLMGVSLSLFITGGGVFGFDLPI